MEGDKKQKTEKSTKKSPPRGKTTEKRILTINIPDPSKANPVEPVVDKGAFALLTSDFSERALSTSRTNLEGTNKGTEIEPTHEEGTPSRAPKLTSHEYQEYSDPSPGSSSDNAQEDAEESENKGMEHLLKEAANPSGFRLTWILYSMIFVVIALFVMILVQTTFTMNNALRTSGKQTVQSLASSLVNNVRLVEYELDKIFDLNDNINKDNISTSLAFARASLCSRFFGAPQAILNFEENVLTWNLTCNRSFPLNTASKNLTEILVSPEIRLATLSRQNAVAYRINANLSGSAVVLNKQTLGEVLLGNERPDYSSGTLQTAYVGVFLPGEDLNTPKIAFHTLDDQTNTYTIDPSKGIGLRLQNVFDNVCTQQKYVWYNVLSPSEFKNDEETEDSIFQPIPDPYMEFKGSWGLLSKTVLCVAVCISADETVCTDENPTSTWYVIDYHPTSMGQTAVKSVGIVSIVALILFSLLAIVDYISITIPVNYLRDQLLRIVGPRRDHSNFYKHMVRWSYRLWLGDLKALIKTLHILRFCYEHNQKYVPQHVLKRQEEELYQHRSKLFLLYKMELVDNVLSGGDDSDEEFDLSPRSPREFDRVDSGTFIFDRENTEVAVGLQNSMSHHFDHESISVNESSVVGVEVAADREASFLNSTINGSSSVGGGGGGKSAMSIKRAEEAAMLCIHFTNIENSYAVNYGLAVKQHRRLMRYTLSLIRKHKGVLFHRAGDCLIVAWNAFNVCGNHTQKAVECAMEFAATFAPYKSEGFQVGIVVHKGQFVCGIVEDSKEAFITAFGEAPNHAAALSRLAATQPYYGFLVTEPVKQTLSSMYDFGVVDVISGATMGHVMYLYDIVGRRDRKNNKSDFIIQYTKAFSKFRNHEFEESLEGIHYIRKMFPKESEALVARLELLCRYYGSHRSEIPKPYSRLYPSWENYEQKAQNALPACYYGTPLDQPGSATMVYELPVAFHNQNDDDDAKVFREELHSNLRRLGSPALKSSPHLSYANSAAPSVSGTEGRQSPWTPAGKSPKFATAAIEDSRAKTGSSHDVSGLAQTVSPAESPSQRVIESPQPLPVFGAQQAATSSNSSFVSNAEQSRLDVLIPLSSVTLNEHTSGDMTARKKGADKEDENVTENQTNTNNNASCDDGKKLGLTGNANSFLNQISLIQSIGLTANGAGSNSFFSKLPTEIEAKNGVLYTRSARLLGKGSYGEVYLGMEMLSGKLVAIKFMPMPFDESEIEAIEAEVNIMQKVKGSCVVELISYAFEEETIVLVMECMMAGSLQNMISAFHVIPNVTARVFMRDVLRGLSRLHSYKVLHRDVKPQNVLLTLSGTCKISDFGASTWLQRMMQRETQGEVQGTPVYLAPEAARGMPVMQSDIWSCGIMFLQLITGSLPYTKEQLSLSPSILVYQLGSGSVVPIIPPDLDELDAVFVSTCLQIEPEKRTTAEKLLRLPLFLV